MTFTVTSPLASDQSTFGGVDHTTPVPAEIDFIAIQRSDEFVALRRGLRRFVFPASGLFFAWYLSYVLLAAYAHGFMSRRIAGQVTVGLGLGLLQFASTIAIMLAYLRYARVRIDPRVAVILERHEPASPRTGRAFDR